MSEKLITSTLSATPGLCWPEKIMVGDLVKKDLSSRCYLVTLLAKIKFTFVPGHSKVTTIRFCLKEYEYE